MGENFNWTLRAVLIIFFPLNFHPLTLSPSHPHHPPPPTPSLHFTRITMLNGGFDTVVKFMIDLPHSWEVPLTHTHTQTHTYMHTQKRKIKLSRMLEQGSWWAGGGRGYKILPLTHCLRLAEISSYNRLKGVNSLLHTLLHSYSSVRPWFATWRDNQGDPRKRDYEKPNGIKQ